MRRVLTAVFLACALPLLAQETPSTTPAGSNGTGGTATAKSGDQGSTDQPITFSFGPQEGGGFGAVVKGSQYYPFRPFITGNATEGSVVTPDRIQRFTKSAYLYLSPEVNWSTEAGAINQYSLSARPSFQLGYLAAQTVGPDGIPTLNQSTVWPAEAPFFEVYLDVRRQSATKAASDDATTTLAVEAATPEEAVDATFYGVGLGIAVPYIARAIEKANSPADPGAFPMLRVTYYKSDGASAANSTIASGIKADQINASLTFSLPLPTMSGVEPRFDFDGSLSRATTGDDREWKDLVKAAILFKIGDSQFKPVISYTSGQKLGFQYDRQLLMGLAFDFAKGFFGGK